MAAVVKDCLKYQTENKLLVNKDNADDEITLREHFTCIDYPRYVKCIKNLEGSIADCKRAYC